MPWIDPGPPPGGGYTPPPIGGGASTVADDLSAYVSQWDLTGDLQAYARAIGQMFAEVESYAADADATVGWQSIWDVNLAPHNALPWLAMLVGETAPAGATDAQLRALIQAAPNQYRGTPLAIADAVKQVLTGSQTVGLRERWRSDTLAVDEDALSIFTFASQTPSQAAVQAALRRTVPADIIVYYTALSSSSTWAAFTGETWATVESTYGTWGGVLAAGAAPTGYTLY